MNDFLRRLEILRRIPRQASWDDDTRPAVRTGRCSAGQLLDELRALGYQGNLRAIQRDLVFLGDLLPDLQHDDAHVGGRGWFWRKDSPVLDLPGLNPAMALTFVMAQALLRPLLPPPLLDHLAPYFDAAARVLAKAGAPGWVGWKDRVRVIPFGQPLRPAVIDPAVLRVVQTALLEERRFRGRYQPRGREPAEFEFNPLGLVFRDRVIYLVATLWDYADLRHFALHRLQQAELLEQAVTIPEGFDLDAYLAGGPFDYAPKEGRRIRLTLRMDAGIAAHLAETPLAEDQTLREDTTDGDWILLRATVLETEQLVWWLLGFGDQVEVLQPKKLRTRIAATVRSMAALYT